MVTSVLRTGWRVLASILLVTLLISSVLAGWVFFYRRDLPDLEALGAFAPGNGVRIETMEHCGEITEVKGLPAVDMGQVPQAVVAAEGDLDPRSVPRRIYEEFGSDVAHRYGMYSIQLARGLFCRPERRLNRALAEWRTSIQIERHFNPDQVLTIYLNRASFGDGIYGIEDASEHYFRKRCRDLSTSEAALLAALIRRPSYLSPTKHPDRALARRNEVLDEMANRGSITAGEAEIAKTSPLGVRNP
jgi:membrane carboxypeptidase/penicillin-binding protein